jgi:hypothetical protein
MNFKWLHDRKKVRSSLIPVFESPVEQTDVMCNVRGRGDGGGSTVCNLQHTLTIRLAGSARM